MRLIRPVAVAALLAVLLAPQLPAAERSEIPDQYKWDLTSLYPDEAAWVAAKQDLVTSIPRLGQWQGRLGESPATLLAAMTDIGKTRLRADRLYSYASQLYDQDTRVSRSLQLQQEASQVYTELQTATSFVRPELISVGRAKIDGFIAAEPKLGEYRMFFDDALRAAPHTLSMSRGKDRRTHRADGGYGTYRLLGLHRRGAAVPGGHAVERRKGPPRRRRLHEVSGPAVESRSRCRVQGVLHALRGIRRNACNHAQRARAGTGIQQGRTKVPDTLEAALFTYNIPTSVYSQLITDVHANLPTLHRYLRLRQKIMGLPQLGYEDLYAPIVKNVQLKFTPEEAKKLTLESFAPLGPAYVDALRKGYDSRWVDFLPNTGKSSGAYSTNVYDVHPYQLLNFTGTWEEVSTLAHESGHSMHSYLAAASQPYATADYAIFVAEVASTLNENLLFHHVLDQTKDDATRLFLLSSYLDTMRTTLFRQTMFAEFELMINQAVERGEPLTKESLDAMYLKLVRQYYGSEQGIVKVDATYASEWAYIPHFYRNFYVYQYATSMIGGMTLAENIIGRQAVASGSAEKGRDAYLKLLSSGSSKYPIDLLKEAGVDMTTSQPFEAAMREMNRIMDEIEQIYARRKG